MNNYKSSGELKALAKEHLFGRYGASISALFLVGIINFALSNLTISHINTSTILGAGLFTIGNLCISILMGVINSGICYFYLKICCDQRVVTGDILYGFRSCPEKALGIQAWICILTFVVSLPNTIIEFYLTAMANGTGIISLLNDMMLNDGAALNNAQSSGIIVQNSLLPTNVGLLILIYCVTLIISGAGSVIISLFYSQSLYLLHDFPQYSAKELLSLSRDIMKGNKGRLFYIYVSFIPLILLSILSLGIALLWVVPYMRATTTEFFLDVMRNRNVAQEVAQ